MDEGQILFNAEMTVALAIIKDGVRKRVVYIYDDDLRGAGIADAQKTNVVRVTAEWIDLSEVEGG